MQFSSILFLSIFLPFISVGTFVMRRHLHAQNIFLLIAGLLFYAWGEPKMILALLVFALFNWLIPLQFSGARRLFWLILLVSCNVLFLFVVKYSNFFIQNVNLLTGARWPVLHIALPLGISFYTFKGLSYAIDVYRGEEVAQKNALRVLLYLSFFPQITAGPIMRYGDFNRQLDARVFDWEKSARGLRRFICGLAKKLLLANILRTFVDFSYGLEGVQLNSAIAWTAAICYMLQIYYDFSGYSDMAIGMGQLLGFDTTENFNSPYSARSMQDFWRRWHITLSTWFRDYVYIPLGGNRKGQLRTRCNKMIVFLLTGLWHGANWTFVLWGCFHGFFLLVEEKIKPGNWKKGLGHLYALMIIVLSFVIFRAESLNQAGMFFQAMFSGFAWSTETASLYLRQLSPSSIGSFIMAVFLLFPWKKNLQGKGWEALGYAASFALLLLCILHVSAAGYQPFIYEQF